MTGTIQALDWAFKLEDVSPQARLVAIYMACRVGQDRIVAIDLANTARWCGFVSPAHKVPRTKDVKCALQEIPGITYDYHDNGAALVDMGGAL